MKPSDLLEQHHIRKTSPRIAIIEALQKQEVPLTESEIKDEMGELYDRITFYRSVQTMVEAEILHRVVIDNTLVKYALNRCESGKCTHSVHSHFYCRSCGKLFCLDEFHYLSALPDGFVQEKADLLLQGKCADCILHESR